MPLGEQKINRNIREQNQYDNVKLFDNIPVLSILKFSNNQSADDQIQHPTQQPKQCITHTDQDYLSKL